MSYKAASKPLVSVRARVNMLLLIVVSALGYIGFGEFVEYRDQVLEEEKVAASAPVQKSERWDKVYRFTVIPDEWRKYTYPKSSRRYLIQFNCPETVYAKTSMQSSKTFTCNKDTIKGWVGSKNKVIYFAPSKRQSTEVIIKIRYI